MKPNKVRLPGFYVARIVAFVEQAEAGEVGWCRPFGISEVDPDGTVTLEWSVFHAFVEEAKRLSGDPGIGLLIGEQLSINTHGQLGYAAINSATIRATLQLLETFLPLRTDLLTITHEVRDGLMVLHFREPTVRRQI